MDENIYIHEYDNGVRLLHHQISGSAIAHCGFFINCGSRDEQEGEVGLAHFIEHMLFKGTKKRKSHHILNRMDNVGAELNAYTSKEKTCIYSSFPQQFFERAVELICDITYNSTFPEIELVKERNVVADEITMYQDNPDESLYDDFLEVYYKDHSLGNNILGSIESLNSFNSKNLQKFVKRSYHNTNMVFTTVGSMPFEKVKTICSKYINESPFKTNNITRIKPKHTKPFSKEIKKDLHQMYCMLGYKAYQNNHPNKYKVILLNNILGGPAMNSRLNMGIREKYGFCYNIYSDVQSFVDTGLATVSFATDQKNFDRCLQLVHKEIELFKNKKMSTLQLATSKRQFIGQMQMSEENKSAVLTAIANALLDNGRVATFKEVAAEIEKTTASKLMDMANEIWDSKHLCSLSYVPKNDK